MAEVDTTVGYAPRVAHAEAAATNNDFRHIRPAAAVVASRAGVSFAINLAGVTIFARYFSYPQ